MRSFQIALGIGLILGGMAFGIGVTLYYFSEGILFIKAGYLREGLIILLLWSEVLGILATVALVIPGVLLLRTINGLEPTGDARRPSDLVDRLDMRAQN